MKFSTIISLLAGFTAIAHPVTAEEPLCDPISKYTTEWFLENTRPEWKSKSFDSNALFYTAGLSTRAKQFARHVNKITIWGVWPCENYFIKETRQNPLRCIMSNLEEEMIYFENMSRAFAMKAHNIASVMHRNIEEPPLSTIWGRIELPTLQAEGTVDWITAIEADDINRRRIEWIRNLPTMLKEETESMYQRILQARDDEDASGDIEEMDEFDACPVEVGPTHPLW